MVLVCLPSDALSQHLPSYLGFSYLGRGVSPHWPPLVTLNTALPDLEHGVAPLGPPVPTGGEIALISHTSKVMLKILQARL